MAKMSNKVDWFKVKKIGIDIDDVVVKTASSFLDFYNKKHGTNFVFDDIEDYDLGKSVGISEKEVRKELDVFFNSEEFHKMDLIEKSKETIEFLAKNFEIVFITSRPLKYEKNTKNHLGYHFGNLDFEIIHSTGHSYEDSSSKGEICRDYGIDLMIEDNADYARDCSSRGVNVFLLDKPWNRNKEIDPNIVKVRSWKDILNELNGLEEVNKI